MLKNFYVIAVISNPVRYKSRYALYKKFFKAMHQECGAHLITVECAFGDRSFEITDPTDKNHIQLRTYDELWHKENMINVAISRLPSDWEYVAWIDADVLPVTSPRQWITETWHQLQHHMVVQMWTHAIDLGPRDEVIQNHTSFGYCHSMGLPVFPKHNSKYTFPHPGFAWAARREAIDGMYNGLLDVPILGSADHHMAYGFLGRIEETIPNGVHANYTRHLMRWQEHAVKNLKMDIGFVNTTILHFWHGKKKDRRYQDRWKIIQRNDFDPSLDIKKDSQGLYVLSGNKHKLRDELRSYFRSRNEDSIDAE